MAREWKLWQTVQSMMASSSLGIKRAKENYHFRMVHYTKANSKKGKFTAKAYTIFQTAVSMKETGSDLR